MLKVRITFVDNDKGKKELKNLINILKENTNILSESDIYKGRGKSIYSNVYIDLEDEDLINSDKKYEYTFEKIK